MIRASLAATLYLATTSLHDCKAADEQEALRVAARALFHRETARALATDNKKAMRVVAIYEDIPKELVALAVCVEAAATGRISYSWRF